MTKTSGFGNYFPRIIAANTQRMALSRILRLFIILSVALLVFFFLVPLVASQNPTQSVLLIDIPGVNWTGEARESDWGTLLSPDKITIYIRHRGPGLDRWSPPAGADAIVITLPDQWDERSAGSVLLPAINETFAKGKDVHVIVGKNITLSGHLLPLTGSDQEDHWAAKVTEYILKHKPSNFIAVLAEHSRGTVTNDHITDFGGISYIIIASPRGDQSLGFISRIPASIKVDIITGIWDAPSWRWRERLSDIVSSNLNVRIIQLQDFSLWTTTHSRLQNTQYNGIWKIITADGETVIQGTLEQILEFPERQKGSIAVTPYPSASTPPAGMPTAQGILPPPPTPGSPQPSPGGVDFASVDLRYLTEHDDLVGVAFRAVPAQEGTGVGLAQALDLAWNSFFIWLALPSDKFWVNLNPNEPHRVVDPELGRTDVGRIMLQADFEMKKTVAKLIHPDSETGKLFWDQLYGYAARQQLNRLCFSFRQWILPGNVVVYADANEVYVVTATLSVELESDYQKTHKTDTTAATACPPDVDPALQAQAEDLFRKIILPELIRQVNTAPEYRDIRTIFHSRIVAEWYRTQHRDNARAFVDILGSGDVKDWYSITPWDPQTLFEAYVQSVTNGEFNITRQTQVIEGNQIITSKRTYFYGGVDFTKIEMETIDYSTLVASKPDVLREIFEAIFNWFGALREDEIWLGELYETSQREKGGGGGEPQWPLPLLTPGIQISAAPPMTAIAPGGRPPQFSTETQSDTAPQVIAIAPGSQPPQFSMETRNGTALPVTASATPTPPGGSIAPPCGIGALAVILFVWTGWIITRRYS